MNKPLNSALYRRRKRDPRHKSDIRPTDFDFSVSVEPSAH